MKLTKNSRIKIALIVTLCAVICLGLGTCTTGHWNWSWWFPNNASIPTAPSAPTAPNAPAAPNAPSVSETSNASEFFSGAYGELSRAEFDANAVKDIHINWEAGAVRIKVTDDEDQYKIQVVEYTGGSSKSYPRMAASCVNEILTIDYRASFIGGFAGCGFFGHKVLEITLPIDAAESLRLLEISGASGQYDLQGFYCETLETSIASGSFVAQDVNAKELRINAASGQLAFSGEYTDQIDLNLASGNLQITSTATELPKAIYADIMSGNVTLNLPQDPGFTATVDRVSGEFNCDFDTLNREGSLVYGDGSCAIDIDIASGNVSLLPTKASAHNLKK